MSNHPRYDAHSHIAALQVQHEPCRPFKLTREDMEKAMPKGHRAYLCSMCFHWHSGITDPDTVIRARNMLAEYAKAASALKGYGFRLR
jgi:hypothetical protein